MGNVTSTPIKVYSIGDRKEAIVDYTFSNSYATGGDTLVPANVGFENELNSVQVISVTTAGAISLGKAALFDHVGIKLALFTTPFSVEATNATDNSTVKVRCKVVGKGSISA